MQSKTSKREGARLHTYLFCENSLGEFVQRSVAQNAEQGLLFNRLQLGS